MFEILKEDIYILGIRIDINGIEVNSYMEHFSSPRKPRSVTVKFRFTEYYFIRVSNPNIKNYSNSND